MKKIQIDLPAEFWTKLRATFDEALQATGPRQTEMLPKAEWDIRDRKTKQRLLSIDQVAKQLNVPRSTLYNWRHMRKFAVVHLGRRVLIPQTEIDRLIKENITPKKEPQGVSTKKCEKEKSGNLDAACCAKPQETALLTGSTSATGVADLVNHKTVNTNEEDSDRIAG
jgi:excisionase family DNA binding protein